jgi:hypothetical protein
VLLVAKLLRPNTPALEGRLIERQAFRLRGLQRIECLLACCDGVYACPELLARFPSSLARLLEAYVRIATKAQVPAKITDLNSKNPTSSVFMPNL